MNNIIYIEKPSHRLLAYVYFASQYRNNISGEQSFLPVFWGLIFLKFHVFLTHLMIPEV